LIIEANHFFFTCKIETVIDAVILPMVLQKNFTYSRNDRLMGLELFAPRTPTPISTF
jgi:hypothetical protein